MGVFFIAYSDTLQIQIHTHTLSLSLSLSLSHTHAPHSGHRPLAARAHTDRRRITMLDSILDAVSFRDALGDFALAKPPGQHGRDSESGCRCGLMRSSPRLNVGSDATANPAAQSQQP